MAIEANDEAFSIHETGDTTGNTYTGDFRAKKWLSHRDNLLRDQIRRDLLGGQPGQPTERALSTSHILSELKVRIVQAPDWWTTSNFGVDLYDDSIIGKLFDEVMAVEAKAMEVKKKKAQKVVDQLREEADKKAAEDAAEVKSMEAK